MLANITRAISTHSKLCRTAFPLHSKSAAVAGVMRQRVFENPHIKADIRYLSTFEGGRETPIHSGYRGQFHYENESPAWDAPQEFIDKDTVMPGERVTVHLKFMSPSKHINRLKVGLKFYVKEGARIVGSGIVTVIYPALLEDAECE